MNRSAREWVRQQTPSYVPPQAPKPKPLFVPVPPPTPVWSTSNGDHRARREAALLALNKAAPAVVEITLAEQALLVKAGALSAAAKP